MAEIKCETCTMRQKYDAKPKSLLGRFWRWHINWCPGWKQYMLSLSEADKRQVAEKYNQNKYL